MPNDRERLERDLTTWLQAQGTRLKSPKGYSDYTLLRLDDVEPFAIWLLSRGWTYGSGGEE